MRNFDRSAAEWQNILELDPGFRRASMHLTMIHEVHERFEEAIENYAEGRLRADSSAATLADVEELRRVYANRGSIGYWEWRLENTPAGAETSAGQALLPLWGGLRSS